MECKHRLPHDHRVHELQPGAAHHHHRQHRARGQPAAGARRLLPAVRVLAGRSWPGGAACPTRAGSFPFAQPLAPLPPCRLQQAPSGPVTINISSLSPSLVNVSAPSVTFSPANWSSAQYINITAGEMCVCVLGVGGGGAGASWAAGGITDRLERARFSPDILRLGCLLGSGYGMGSPWEAPRFAAGARMTDMVTSSAARDAGDNLQDWSSQQPQPLPGLLQPVPPRSECDHAQPIGGVL